MRCPFCGHEDTRVIDSRPTEEGLAIRRRRECEACAKRFTTYEKVEEITLIVVKKDGRREAFDRNKIMNGIIRACEKRPVPLADIENIVCEVERALNNAMEKEMESSIIGEYVMEHLKKLDDVAFVRFASVYRQFTDAESFRQEIDKILGKRSAKKTPARSEKTVAGKGGGHDDAKA